MSIAPVMHVILLQQRPHSAPSVEDLTKQIKSGPITQDFLLSFYNRLMELDNSERAYLKDHLSTTDVDNLARQAVKITPDERDRTSGNISLLGLFTEDFFTEQLSQETINNISLELDRLADGSTSFYAQTLSLILHHTSLSEKLHLETLESLITSNQAKQDSLNSNIITLQPSQEEEKITPQVIALNQLSSLKAGHTRLSSLAKKAREKQKAVKELAALQQAAVLLITALYK